MGDNGGARWAEAGTLVEACPAFKARLMSDFQGNPETHRGDMSDLYLLFNHPRFPKLDKLFAALDKS
jgi:hypothetical protein